MFFSFDGIDGAGKSTQIAMFRDWLRQRDHDVLVCRDPGGTHLGEQIRSILLEPSELPIDVRAEMLLYMASRAQLVSEIIRPALSRGKSVIADRYVPANVAYQGYGGGLAPELIARTGELAVDSLYPDLTFILDVDYATSQARLGGVADRMESRGERYFNRVREGFLEQAAQAPERMLVIDASRDIASVHQSICDAASAQLTRASSTPDHSRQSQS